MIKHAVFATDLSKVSDILISNAHKLKQLGIEKITVINVYRALVNIINPTDIDTLEIKSVEDASAKLESQKTEFQKIGFSVESDILIGTPSTVLRDIVKEKNADILIIGSHGYCESDSVLGGTAYEILTNVKSPTLLLVLQKEKPMEVRFSVGELKKYEEFLKESRKKGQKWEQLCTDITTHILLPTDFSDFAEAAFQKLKAIDTEIPELTLMHVQDEIRIRDHMGEKLEEFNRIDNARLLRLKSAFNLAHPETRVNIVIEYGKPKEVILDYINGKGRNRVSLTVMGSQGRGHLSRLFLGSVSHYVARHSDSNVLMVPLKS